MTSEQHEPVERLAAYAAGDLDASAALEVEAHVLLCPDCRADVDAVRRVGSDLAALPPVPMPEDVAAKIDAALAAEADATPGLSVLREAAPGGDILPLERKRRWPALSAIAAVAAGVALLGAVTVPYLSGQDTPDSATMDSGGDARAAQTRRLESGLTYGPESARDVLVQALSGEQNVFGAPQDTVAKTVSPGAPEASGGGGEPQAGTSGDQVELRYSSRARSELAPLRTDAARLSACIDSLATGLPEIGRRPLVVDFGTFQGRPALIVVFPTIRRGEIRPDRVDFFVVGPRCGVTAGDDDLLFFARFAPPPGL